MSNPSSGDVQRRLASDLLADKLADPAAEAALCALIDQAGTLAFILQGVDELLARGDVIADSLASGVGELKLVTALDAARARSLRLADVTSNFAKLTVSLSESSPAIAELLDSGMFRSDVVQLLAKAADAAVEAKERASTGAPRVQGARSILKSLKDPEVQRGMTFIVELAAALGRRV